MRATVAQDVIGREVGEVLRPREASPGDRKRRRVERLAEPEVQDDRARLARIAVDRLDLADVFGPRLAEEEPTLVLLGAMTPERRRDEAKRERLLPTTRLDLRVLRSGARAGRT